MASNNSLVAARNAKNDEFYTRRADIEAELGYYEDYFKGKTIFCNCDDPYESEFFKYFILNFDRFRLKSLISTSYASSLIGGSEFDKVKIPYKAIVKRVKDMTGDGAFKMEDVKRIFELEGNSIEELKGDGDFRSPECIELLKQADIVVTNPPFSLFREYVALLVKYNKNFIIMGNKNAITYKEFFPLFKNNKIWAGRTSLNGGRWMIIPDNVESTSSKVKIDDSGHRIINVPGVCWFTNMDTPQRHEELKLYKKYTPEEYPEFDNYRAINVGKVAEIPDDYYDPMGVPITYFAKHCPEQFEVLDANDYRKSNSVPKKPHGLIKDKESAINGKPVYARVLIRKRNLEKYD